MAMRGRSAIRANKYGNRKTKAGGVMFDSWAEAKFYLKLLDEERKGIVKEIELQPRFELQPKFEKNGVKHRAITYLADFKVTYANGKVRIIDVKGKRTEVFNIKHKMFEYKYPELELIIVKV